MRWWGLRRRLGVEEEIVRVEEEAMEIDEVAGVEEEAVKVKKAD